MKKIFLSLLVLSLPSLSTPSLSMTKDYVDEEKQSSKLSVGNLQRIDILEALWNNATGCPLQPQNQFAYQQTLKDSFPRDNIAGCLQRGQTHFDYIASRVIKVTFFDEGSGSLDPFNYNTNHGAGKVEQVLGALRQTGATALLPGTKPEGQDNPYTQQLQQAQKEAVQRNQEAHFNAFLAQERDPEDIVAERRAAQKKLDAAETEEEKARIVFASAGWDPNKASSIMKRLQAALDEARGKGKK